RGGVHVFSVWATRLPRTLDSSAFSLTCDKCAKAQEKATVWRTERRRNAQTGQPYAWLVQSTALVNQYYIYAVDADFGPFFLKFCSYFPYNAKLCVNGHAYLKRQLVKEGIAFEALDNGIVS